MTTPTTFTLNNGVPIPALGFVWGGAFHGSDGFCPQAAVSQASTAARDEFIRRALER